MPKDVLIARKLISMALEGNLDAIHELADRVEGKARQRIEQSGPDGGPIPYDLPNTREALELRIAELLGTPTTPTKPSARPAKRTK